MAQLDPPRALLDELAARWRLTLGRPLAHDGLLSWVARVRRDGEPLVLKVTRVHDEGRDEAAGLRAWDGRGAVRLIEDHESDGVLALLLEDCVPGTPLSTRPPEEQDEVLAGLLRRLWIDPPRAPFRPLAQMCAWWADEAAAKGVPADLTGGLDLFRSLPLDTPDERLLVTDLHGGNVLAAGREPWLAIDPKPYAGDPHYDALQHMLNFPDRLAADPGSFSDRLARLCGLDPARLRLWLFARAVQESPDQPYLADVARALSPG